MKADWTEINRHRLKHGTMGSDDSFGHNGAFMIRRGRVDFIVIASDGTGAQEMGIEAWEHVSARARELSGKERVPTWEEMCWLKDFFFDPEECVVQYHPPHSEYCNNHPFVLHLWKPIAQELPRPPSHLVGIPNKR